MEKKENKIQDMLSKLNKLKQYGLVYAKISFEDEGVSYDAAEQFADIAKKAGIGLAVKIGGCEAITDLAEAKKLGASHIVATMIESAYAIHKFTGAIKSVYGKNMLSTDFFINVETITGYKNLSKMLALDDISAIRGVVLGRVDFVTSMGKDRSFIDSKKMLDISTKMAKLVTNTGKEMFIGGGITIESLDTFKHFPADLITAVETRNGVFDFNKVMNNFNAAILQITGFELLWLKLRNDLGDKIDKNRIEMLEKRYSELSGKG